MFISAPAISIYFGLFLLGVYAWMCLRPEASDRLLRAFPRSVLPARILVSISLVWFAMNLWQVDLGGFNGLKNLLFVAVPVAYFLVLRYTPDLLAVRGLCTFVLLSAQTVLTAVRWHGSPAHCAVAVLVYVLIVKAMILVVYPHLWIRGLNWLKASAGRRKAGLGTGMVVGAAMLLAGSLSF